MPERHLVTGGSGYAGSVLVRHLREAGHVVRVLDLCDVDDRPADVEFVGADIRDAGAVRRACVDVDVVHHNVALVPLAKDRDAFWTVNRDGTRNLLDAALREGVRKVVHTSSSAVFGVPDRFPVDDATPPRPREDYGRAKLAAEEECANSVARGLDVTILRPRTLLGHGRLGIMQVVFEWVRTGCNVPVLGGGGNVYQFLHVDDFAAASVRAATRPGPRTYNVGAARFGSMRETLDALVRHAGTGSRVVSLPRRPTEFAMKLTGWLGLSPLGPYHWLMYGESMAFDLIRARGELDWDPRYGNEEMFIESYDWYLAHREALMRSTGTASHHRTVVRSRLLGWVGRGMRWL